MVTLAVDPAKYLEAWDWRNYARPEQLEPETDWQIWLIKTGRGWGKTRTGAETTLKKVREGVWRHPALVGQSAGDVRDTMVDELRIASGILTCARPDESIKYEPSKSRIVMPDYGAVLSLYSAEDPDALRGPQHDGAWADEVAAWKRTKRDETWSNLMFGLRQGEAQCIVTTTPRPIKLIRDLMKSSHTVTTEGTTYQNLQNLSKAYIERNVKPYEGTRLGRQELQGQILDDNPDALWKLEQFDEMRIDVAPPNLTRVGVAVDPAGSKSGHEIGIMAGGMRVEKGESVGYLLGDYSLNGTPFEWGKRAIDAYELHNADFIAVETNYGGEMVASNIVQVARATGRPVPHIIEVRATRGKVVRAEPISALGEKGRIKHVGAYPQLEEQASDFIAGDADDRVDAYVWLFTELIAGKEYELISW